LNTRNDLFARSYYPLSKLEKIYDEEQKKFTIYDIIDVYWNGEKIGFVKYRNYNTSLVRNHWNGYFKKLESTQIYNENNMLPFGKFKGCQLQEITFCNEEYLGFDHAHYWDNQPKNYTTLEMAKNEVIAMYHVYNNITPFPQYTTNI